MVGSSYAALKQAIVTTLRARDGLSDVAVFGAPPAKPSEVLGVSGSRKAIWIADADGTHDVTVVGAPNLWLDETYSLLVVFQSLPLDSGDGQFTTDQRVDEMLGEFYGAHADNITSDTPWGLTMDDDPFVSLETLPGSMQRFTGPFTDTTRYPSRCELQLDVTARLKFT